MSTARHDSRWYYQEKDKACPTISGAGRNLNLCYLDGKLDPCHHRDDMLQTIQKTLLRKNKANILLTGVAGCGKTAVVEGLAALITRQRQHYLRDCEKSRNAFNERLRLWREAGSHGEMEPYEAPPAPPLCNSVIYDLSINSLVSNTRYRGEFEAKLEKVMDECIKNPDVILFVDEFHCVIQAGATAESASGAGQILKPALARGDIRMIGATTDEEKELVLKDKAFARRFSQVQVEQLQGAAALDTARSILKHYCDYHNILTDVAADEILSQIQFHLPDTVFPDNFINVVDETLAGAVFDGKKTVGRTQFYETLSRLSGYLILAPDAVDTTRAG